METTIQSIITERSLSSLKGIIKNRRLSMNTRMLAFVEHTVRVFAGGQARAWDVDRQQCIYSPVPSRNSPGCAIGCMLPRSVSKLLDNSYILAWSDVLNLVRKSPDKLREYEQRVVETVHSKASWILDFNESFLSNLQSLHDREENWDSSGVRGLSSKGGVSVELILRYIKNGAYNW